MHIQRLSPDQFRLWRSNADGYREKLCEEVQRLFGDSQLRAPNGNVLKHVRAGARNPSTETFVAPHECPCRLWPRPATMTAPTEPEHHPECKEGKRWSDARAGKPVAVSDPMVGGVPTKVVHIPNGQVGVNAVAVQGAVIDPKQCEQCRNWTMPDGTKRPLDAHHPMCQYREAWEFQTRQHVSQQPSAVPIAATPAIPPPPPIVEPEDCTLCKDWAWPTGGAKPTDRHHPMCQNEEEWLKGTMRPKLVNITTQKVLKLPTADEVARVTQTFLETGMATIEIDNVTYELQNFVPPPETETPPAPETEPEPEAEEHTTPGA